VTLITGQTVRRNMRPPPREEGRIKIQSGCRFRRRETTLMIDAALCYRGDAKDKSIDKESELLLLSHLFYLFTASVVYAEVVSDIDILCVNR